jgi:hypothetical protein
MKAAPHEAPGWRIGVNRRDTLWIGFGILWMVDGLLQAQPAMFTQQFVTKVLQPAAQGQPQWLADLLAPTTLLWQTHAVAANFAAILAELAIGALFVFGRARPWGRVGLALAIGWGLLVWVFAEGMGGLLAGSPTALTGAPGAALVYVAGALLLLLPSRWWRRDTSVRWTRRALGWFWLLAALIQALPTAGYWTPMGLGMLFQGAAAQPQPTVLAAPIAAVAALAAQYPLVANTCFVAVMVALGVAFLFGGTRGWAYGLGFCWLGFSWWMGQDFGALFSGTGTDPGTALPLALLTLTVAPHPRWWRSKIGIADVRHGNTVPLLPGRVQAASEDAPRG